MSTKDWIKKHYAKRGIKLSDKECFEAANNLVGFFQLLYEINEETQVIPTKNKNKK